MKTVKITLAVIVVAAITASVIFGIVSISQSAKIQLPKNQFAELIEQKIESLKKMPESSFCEKFYEEIKYYIEDDYSNKRLGSTQSENYECKKNLSSNLYAAYTDKFIKQSFYFFNGSEWEAQKLDFIREEYQALQKYGSQTGMLEKNSNTNNKFNEIKSILSKYDEITGFINSCKAFSLSNYADLNISFPFPDVDTKINRSKKYLINNLENYHVKNCKRLYTNLSEVPMILFKANVKYLDNKINYFSGKYINYSSQKEYSDNLFTPINDEIGMLYSEIYHNVNISGIIVDAEHDKLNAKWSLDGTAAYNKFQQ
jgi:hypothetical protein